MPTAARGPQPASRFGRPAAAVRRPRQRSATAWLTWPTHSAAVAL